MLVLKNNQVLKNSDVNSLQVVNTNVFNLVFVTTGPIRVYWGDGTYVDVPAKSTWYTLIKNYSIIGNWNIIISNAENVKMLNFSSSVFYTKIASNVIWFYQFINLEVLTINNATFSGDLATVINKLPKFVEIHLTMSIASQLQFNVSNCTLFWDRCLVVEMWDNINSFFKGSFSDININLQCKTLILYYIKIDGNLNGIIKNGYTQLIVISIYSGLIKTFPFTNISDFIIPDSLTTISHLGDSANYGDLNSFNFKNLSAFYTSGTYSVTDLSNNVSFNNAVKNNLSTLRLLGLTNQFRMNLAEFTKSSYDNINVNVSNGKNLIYGDINYISKVIKVQLSITGGNNDGSIYGVIDQSFKASYLQLSYVDITMSANDLKYIATKSALVLNGLPNLTGDFNNCNFSFEYPTVGITISQMANLHADVTTFTFNSNYINNSYTELSFYFNPNFTGDLVNFTPFRNKYRIYLNNCSYTNIPGFINKIFTNRNTCLKATGGVTTISVQGNVDNNLLTGTETQPDLGTYTGNINNLTEVQIDNLANGLDYTGTGTNTTWSHKGKIWILKSLRNSSTDSSLRYRVTLNY